jgi:hypothetical protein
MLLTRNQTNDQGDRGSPIPDLRPADRALAAALRSPSVFVDPLDKTVLLFNMASLVIMTWMPERINPPLQNYDVMISA